MQPGVSLLIDHQGLPLTYSERTIRSVELHRGDCSIVGYGANPGTSANLRALELLGAAKASTRNLSPESRRSLAEMIGPKVIGAGEIVSLSGGRLLRADDGECATCAGAGKVKREFMARCPECSGDVMDGESHRARATTVSDRCVPPVADVAAIRRRLGLSATSGPTSSDVLRLRARLLMERSRGR